MDEPRIADDPPPCERTRFLVALLDDDERGRLQPVERYLADFPAIADFVPGADVVEALEMGLRVDVVADAADVEAAGRGHAPGDGDDETRRSLDDLLDGDR